MGGRIHEEAQVELQGSEAASHGAARPGLSCSPETEQLVRARLCWVVRAVPETPLHNWLLHVPLRGSFPPTSSSRLCCPLGRGLDSADV